MNLLEAFFLVPNTDKPLEELDVGRGNGHHALGTPRDLRKRQAEV